MVPTVLFVAPVRQGDATQFTYEWAARGMKMARSLGYNVVTLRGEEATYDNVNANIDRYRPRLLADFSHGCPNSLIGQYECTVTRKFGVEEMLGLINSSSPKDVNDNINIVRKMINPMDGISCPGICSLQPDDPCSSMCLYDTNINKLKGTIVYAVACWSAQKLGKCAINYGIESYIGYSDLLLFPSDSIGSQDRYGDVHLAFLEELLMGNSVAEARARMSSMETEYIKKYKSVKYLALPMLWNKMNIRILGNQNAMMYE